MSEINYQALRDVAVKAGKDKWQAKKINGDFFVIRHGSYTRQHGYTSYQPIAEIDCKPVRDFVAKANPDTVLALLDELEAQSKRIAELEKSEEQLINERDHAESALDDMYFAATGDRPEWSNWFGFSDAVNAVVDRIADLEAKQPSPVVPEEKPMPNPLSMYAVDAVAAIAEVRGWNACRAAMLQRQDNYIKDGWISCSERMPNDKQYVWCWGKSYGWTEYDTFEGYYDWSRNKWWTVTDDGEEPASKVTHWMPLPEPPQEVK